ncbi:Thioesterase/thiol ester dehydrase-isomerase [Corynespora cassiicola Philippines]|uniref:Thioesterase/thiol ester dehydrase-isomerase n=1 Tax=Corynespora cassiicola Philippines TaxID=1448308 RepID=A0A2T2N0G4_CORCC|nr:Thioesterase/thiol ester dehydrase-isomerase [Corynespora cassiicola Philippines]
MTEDLAVQLAIRPVGNDEFTSEHFPIRMGNTAAIAYGGMTLGLGLRAACATVPQTHRLYSALGHFLGPAMLDQKLHCKVFRVRDTRSFATRRVEVSQLQNGASRVVLQVSADFHVVEREMFNYSAPPAVFYTGNEESPTVQASAEDLLARRLITKKDMEMSATMFAVGSRFFENRLPPESMSAQNLNGLAKTAKTTQDQLELTRRSSGDWYRLKSTSGNSNDQVACLAFLMDGGLAGLPLAHQKMFLDDAGACSSLDFALRVFQSGVDLREWHLRESLTIAGGHGRTYSEGRLWDRFGNMVASMTQQCILRPKLASL